MNGKEAGVESVSQDGQSGQQSGDSQSRSRSGIGEALGRTEGEIPQHCSHWGKYLLRLEVKLKVPPDSGRPFFSTPSNIFGGTENPDRISKFRFCLRGFLFQAIFGWENIDLKPSEVNQRIRLWDPGPELMEVIDRVAEVFGGPDGGGVTRVLVYRDGSVVGVSLY